MNSDNRLVRWCYWKCCQWGLRRRTDRPNGSSAPLWKNKCKCFFIIQGIISLVVLPLIFVSLMIEVLDQNACFDLLAIQFFLALLSIYRVIFFFCLCQIKYSSDQSWYRNLIFQTFDALLSSIALIVLIVLIVLIDSCTLSSTELALIYTMVGIQMAFSFSEFISVIMQYDFYFKKRIKTERLARKEEAEVERQYDLNKGEDEFAF